MKLGGKLRSIITLTLMPCIASASVAKHAGIPWDLIQAQAFNFTIFIIFMIFILKKPVIGFFSKFREDFLEESSKAQKVLAAAEKQKKEIEDQLAKLETTYSSRLEISKKEAQDLKQKIVNESKERATKLIADTNESASILFKSAEAGIKNQVLALAMADATQAFSKKIDNNESERLQSEFLEEISAGNL